jgi:hypothetical protein
LAIGRLLLLWSCLNRWPPGPFLAHCARRS